MLKAGLRLDALAWNNKTRLWHRRSGESFVGFEPK